MKVRNTGKILSLIEIAIKNPIPRLNRIPLTEKSKSHRFNPSPGRDINLIRDRKTPEGLSAIISSSRCEIEPTL